MIAIYKRLGETPLEALERLKKARQELEHETLSYAGRLDPMAEGLLLVLVGEENKEREKYLGLDKRYEVEILFGVETDTYDILGKITQVDQEDKKYTEQDVETALKKFEGESVLPYPPYSSKAVHGKPLFQWARENKLNEITIPTTQSEIYSITVLNSVTIAASDLLTCIEERIALVQGDFRQQEILKIWEASLKNLTKDFIVLKITVSCSSGTYMRSLAHELGKHLGTTACALSIKRLKIGDYTIYDSCLAI